jgi:hypothetical protein
MGSLSFQLQSIESEAGEGRAGPTPLGWALAVVVRILTAEKTGWGTRHAQGIASDFRRARDVSVKLADVPNTNAGLWSAAAGPAAAPAPASAAARAPGADNLAYRPQQ